MGTANPVESDYDLKIDDQVTKFLESNHKLTNFLITAAVGTLGYTMSIAIGKDAWGIKSTESLTLLIGGVREPEGVIPLGAGPARRAMPGS